jgi:ABC-type Mn2+/Zn2+ transport system permease subunit
MLDPLIIRAIIGVLFASLSLPIVVIMLLRGSLYIVPEISHVALGGAAIGVLLQTSVSAQIDSFLMVIIFCILASIFVSHAGRRGQQFLGMMLSVSLAISLALYAIIRSYMPADKKVILDGYLISDLLLLSTHHMLILAIVSVAAMALTLLFYREFVYICFDMESAEALGLNINLYDSLLFSISALSTAVIVRAIGVLLSVSLLVLPAAASRLIAQHIEKMITSSFIIAAFSGLLGIIISLQFNIPTSGAIALTSTLLFSLIYFLKRE